MPTGTTLLLIAVVAEWGGIAHLAPAGRRYWPLAVVLTVILALHLGLFDLDAPGALPATLSGLFFLYAWSARPQRLGFILALAAGGVIFWGGAPSGWALALSAMIVQFGGGEAEATAGLLGALTLWSLRGGLQPAGDQPWPSFDFSFQSLYLTAVLGRVLDSIRRRAGAAPKEAHANP